MNRIRKFFMRIKYRFRLFRICRALDIKPYEWQKQFAISGEAHFPQGRRTGKTMAVVLRALIQNPVNPKELYDTLNRDPDFERVRSVQIWTYEEYRRCYEKCAAAGAVKDQAVSKAQFSQEAAKRAGTRWRR